VIAPQSGDRRSGTRALNALESAGLISVQLRATDGTWTVYVEDPAAAHTLRRRAYDGQQEFFDSAIDSRGGMDAQDVRPPRQYEAPDPGAGAASGAGRGSGENLGGCAPHPPPFTFNKERSNTPSPLDLSFPSPSTLPFQSRAAELSARTPSLDDDGGVAKLAAEFCGRVKDLRREPALRVAQAVIDRKLDLDDIRGVLAAMVEAYRHGRLKTEPWCYFIGCMKKRFAALDIPWQTAVGGSAAQPPNQP